MLVCPAILRELRTIQHRRYFMRPVVASDLAAMVALVAELAEVVPDDAPIEMAVRDPKDAAILAAALAGRADYLVIGDDDLLVLVGFQVPIVNPADFLNILDASQ